MSFRVFLIVFLIVGKSFICNSQEKDTIIYYTKTDKIESYISDSINAVFDKVISIVRNDSTVFHDILKKEYSEIDTYISYYDSKSVFDTEFYEKEQLQCDTLVSNVVNKLRNFGISSIDLVSSKYGESDEYILRRVELDLNEYKCFRTYYKNPYPMRLNTNAVTFWEIDNGARRFLGIHRRNNEYFLVIPMFYQSIYFSDIYITFGNASH